MAQSTEREGRRRVAFARLQPSFPVSISMTDVELPGGARLDDDEFVVRTSKDWGLTLKPLVLTTRRLICPSDLTGRSAVSIRLNEVRSVRLSKHAIGFSTISATTAVFTGFGAGYNSAGAPFVWTILLAGVVFAIWAAMPQGVVHALQAGAIGP